MLHQDWESTPKLGARGRRGKDLEVLDQRPLRVPVRYLRRVGCNKKHAFLQIFWGKIAPLTEAVRVESPEFNCSFSTAPQPSQLAVPEGCAEEVEPLLLQKTGRSPSFKQPSAYQLASRAAGL